MHEKTEDGRDRHFFQKIAGEWMCECGERRDQYGYTLPSLPHVLP